MTFISTRRTTTAIIVAAAMTVPATAQADYTLQPTFKTDAAQSSKVQPAGAAEPTFPPANFRGGDSPVDHPGASRAQPAPTTVEVVQPERTIVRDVDEALPIALAGIALLLVLATLGITLVRLRPVPRPGRSS